MQVRVDSERRVVQVTDPSGVDPPREFDLYSDEGFEHLSHLWLKVAWNQKYTYGFSWLGRPIIQLPEDMVRLQEVIFEVRPELIVECGVAHGGSLIYTASLLHLLELWDRPERRGRRSVIGVDIEIRPHNRAAIEAHPLFDRIRLIEGSSTDAETVASVHREAAGRGPVLVLLDSNHTMEHVLGELRAYAPLVTPGSYIVATDGFMRDLADVPRGRASWAVDNPCGAIAAFLKEAPEFSVVVPDRPFNESSLSRPVSHWPEGWLRRS